MIPARARPALARVWAVALGALLCALATIGCRRSTPTEEAATGDEFARWMSTGKTYYDTGEAQKALEPFRQALALDPNSPEAQLNLANALLVVGDAQTALTHAERAIDLDHNLAAAHYVAGCATMRLRQFENALKAFQAAKDLAPTVGATTYQLGRAHMELGHWTEAVAAFQELVGFEPDHPSAHYALGQTLIRLGRAEEANAELEKHRQLVARQPGTLDVTKLERCVHTEARAPFVAEPAAVPGIPVRFTDATATVLPGAPAYRGPLGVIDYNHDGRNSLFVGEAGGFRLLINSNGVFQPHPTRLPGREGATYHHCLVADLQNDRFEDILVLGDRGTHVFKFATNAQITETSQFSRLADVTATDGALVDLDFSGKLDLLTTGGSNATARVLRNLGNLYFKDITATSGIPAAATTVTRIAVEDWNGDEQLDVVLARPDQPPLLLLKPRGGALVPTNSPPEWPAGGLVAFGDLNNDLRPDLWVATADQLVGCLNGHTNRIQLPIPAAAIRQLLPVDYDNDGWLDLVVAGPSGCRAFRNQGTRGFRESTTDLGLDQVATGDIRSVVAADFDQDCDTDVVVDVAGAGLRVLRNDGGHANRQVKVRLVGNRSNASGIGTRVEVTAGGLRLGRRVFTLPVEIGVGQHRTLESLNARWLNLSLNNADVTVDSCSVLPLFELFIAEGSCPFLYAWDGTRFRFVTDLLGAAPLGLRVAENRFVEADPDEYVWIGGEDALQPRHGRYVLQITEELREVLYLDKAELVAVDHPHATEVYTTGKMVPSRPFPPHELWVLGHPHPLRHAERSDGLDVTRALQDVDHHHASPVALRHAQLRGLAEPWSLTLDFGPLPVERPLVLAMTAWLRFGGGMANVGSSHDPDLPFPFPTLEVETAPGQFQSVEVVFGTPAGKTKNFLVDLTGKLPPGSHRLRIRTAYELHWDRLALLEKLEAAPQVTRLQPDRADLHYRGFSEFEDLPWTRPLTPDYARVRPNPLWRITPAGWCTRYGDVLELLDQRDNALALLNGGDELTLEFLAHRLPPVPEGRQRSFFLFSSGWDKDSDFHCEKGWTVEPLPWHGLEDQRYGRQPRPSFPNDAWISRYNTRWVGPWVLRRD